MHLAESSFDIPAMGRQHNSQKTTAPAHSFGSCSRDQSNKVFISPQHEKGKATMTSPGPVYNVPSSVGEGAKCGFGNAEQRVYGKPQYPDSSVDVTCAKVDSQPYKFPSTKGVAFGTELKDNMQNAVLIKVNPQSALSKSPGPFAYDPKDRDVTKQRTPRYSLGPKTKILVSDPQTPRNVGPGSYPLNGSMSEQPSSQKRSNPSYSFGNDKRFPPFKKSDSVLDPHPEIGSLSSFGQQVISSKKSCPTYGFGTATREHKDKTFLVQTALDKGPRHDWGPTPQKHPILQTEKQQIKYS